MVAWFFFFQAEDGIRDLVRSRGLGDVYKRQAQGLIADPNAPDSSTSGWVTDTSDSDSGWVTIEAVSYTHLTLPTSDLV